MSKPLEKIWPILENVSVRHDLDAGLVAGVVAAESGGHPAAVRYQADYPHVFLPKEVKPPGCSLATETVLQKTSFGLMQVMGATARELGFSGWLTELCRPELGLEFGCRFLARLTAMYETEDEAISAYNQGSPRRGSDGFFLNRDYVDRVRTLSKEVWALKTECSKAEGNSDQEPGYRFSAKSRSRLATCDLRLRKLFEAVLKECDVSILEGQRTKERQALLVAQGRSRTLNSKHLTQPSKAVDAAPYPIDWNDIPRFSKFGALVKGTAVRLGIGIVWGGDWRSFKDYVHFELID